MINFSEFNNILMFDHIMKLSLKKSLLFFFWLKMPNI